LTHPSPDPSLPQTMAPHGHLPPADFTAREVQIWPFALAALRPGDLAHDPLHLLRVRHWARKIAPELGVDLEEAGIAALLHDLVQIPKDHPDRSQAAARAAQAAGELLATVALSSEARERICAAIATTSWSAGRRPESPLGWVLHDADRLDAIGCIGVFRNIATVSDFSHRGRSVGFYHPADPFARGDRPIDDRTWAIDHWPRKLFGLADTLYSELARAEGARRLTWMKAAYEQLSCELAPELVHERADTPTMQRPNEHDPAAHSAVGSTGSGTAGGAAGALASR
jgi:uncharacterized protein